MSVFQFIYNTINTVSNKIPEYQYNMSVPCTAVPPPTKPPYTLMQLAAVQLHVNVSETILNSNFDMQFLHPMSKYVIDVPALSEIYGVLPKMLYIDFENEYFKIKLI